MPGPEPDWGKPEQAGGWLCPTGNVTGGPGWPTTDGSKSQMRVLQKLCAVETALALPVRYFLSPEALGHPSRSRAAVASSCPSPTPLPPGPSLVWPPGPHGSVLPPAPPQSLKVPARVAWSLLRGHWREAGQMWPS